MLRSSMHRRQWHMYSVSKFKEFFYKIMCFRRNFTFRHCKLQVCANIFAVANYYFCFVEIHFFLNQLNTEITRRIDCRASLKRIRCTISYLIKKQFGALVIHKKLNLNWLYRLHRNILALEHRQQIARTEISKEQIIK